LADKLNNAAPELKLPPIDIEPNFSKFDDESPEEKENAYLELNKKKKPVKLYLAGFFFLFRFKHGALLHKSGETPATSHLSFAIVW
jgi:hypothetical protein